MNESVNPLRVAIKTENEDILIYLREKEVDLKREIRGANAINYAKTNRVNARTIQILRSANVNSLKRTKQKKTSKSNEKSKLTQKQNEIQQINDLPKEIINFVKYFRSHPDESINIY